MILCVLANRLIEEFGHEMVCLDFSSVWQTEQLSKYTMALEDETDLYQKGGSVHLLLQVIVFTDKGKFVLTIDLKPIGNWFEEQLERFMQGLNVRPSPKQSRLKL